MPGIAIAAEKYVDKGRFDTALHQLQHPRYALDMVDAGDHIAVGYAVHPGYPVAAFSLDGDFVLLEGAVYGTDRATARRELMAILEAFKDDAQIGRAAAERWAAASDGDFVVVAVSRTKSRVLVLNDKLGRLPLYFERTSKAFVIARELKFLRTWNGSLSIDRQSMAQMLLFGWSLGTRTTIEQAKRLAPGSSLYLDVDAGNFELKQYHIWDFEALGQEVPRRSTQRELASLIVDRCRAQASWAESRQLVVSLSGGLDSRNVAAGLVKAGANIIATTIIDDANEWAADATIAQRIADQLGISWNLYELARPTWEDAERLTRLRDGLNFVGVSFMLEYLARVRDNIGPNTCFFTGDGGDKSLGEVRYPPAIKGLDEFVAALLQGGIFPTSSVADFLGLPATDIRECIRAHLAEYPERSGKARAARFAHSEHAWHWLFEGEDRNRSLLWTMTPFYCQSFLARALAISPVQKRGDAFYGHVMKTLNRDVALIPNANWGAPIGSTRARLRSVLHDVAVRLPRPLRNAIRRRVLPFHTATHILPNYRERVSRLFQNPVVNTIFSEAAVERALDLGFSRMQSQVLITQLIHLDQISRPIQSAAAGER